MNHLNRLIGTLMLWSFMGTFGGFGYAAAPSQVIRIGNGAEPKDLDPHVVTGTPEAHILRNLFEGLINKDPKNLAVIPGVAERWKVSKDGKSYTFYLRKNAKWSNQDLVTAQDFVYSWTRLLSPETASEYAYQGYYFKNGKAFAEGKLKDASQLGFKAVDDHTLQIELASPTPFFLALLYHHSLYPVPKKAIEKFGKRWTRPENMVTNGPFTLDRWEVNKIITIKKSPTYWDGNEVKLTGAEFHPTENLDTEEKMFRTGKLDITNEVPLEKLTYWQKDKSGVFQSFPYLGIYYYRVNVKKAPLNNKLLRRAIAFAIDRTKLIKYVTKGNQEPALAFTPPGTGGYEPPASMPKDLSRLEEAKKLLAEAGFPGGKGLPSIEILYNTHEGHKKIAEAIQQMLKTNLGINVTLLNQEWKVYLDSQKTINYQLSRSAWVGDYNDPNTFLDMFLTGGGNNQTGWSNKHYDELIAKAGNELDTKKRLLFFKEAEEILMDELPVIPIYIYRRNLLKAKYVNGWYPNIEDVHPLMYMSLGAH